MAEEERKTTEEEEVTVSEVSGDHGGNPYHEPAGSPKGGEFAEAPKSGDGSGEEGGEKKSPAELLREITKKKKAGMTLSERLRAETQQMDVLKQRRRDIEENDHRNIPTLKNFRQQREKYVNPTMREYVTMTAEEIADLKRSVDPILAHGMLACNFWFRNVLNFIDSDEIKNQFGTGRPDEYSVGSGAGFNTTDPYNSRAEVSANGFGATGVFGSEVRGLSDQEIWKRRCELEKYGCIMDNNPYEAATNRIATQYGDAFWIMNDNIKNRTTFVIGDSLGRLNKDPTRARGYEGIPSFFDEGLHPAQCQFSRSTVAAMKRAKNIHELTDAIGCSYLEAQMHGKLRISRDVYGLSAQPSNWNSPSGRRAFQRLKKMGIKCFTHRGTGYLEELVSYNPETNEYEYRRVE